MALHFTESEFSARRARLMARMAEEKLDALLLFAQESMYWLTGFDSFGYCFFQTLVVKADGTLTLLTRTPDLRQAKQTSTIENIVVWVDRLNADPAVDLRNLLSDLDLLGMRVGVEYDTHGMTGRVARLVDNQLTNFCQVMDASYLVSTLRLVKSPAEIAKVTHAAELADLAYDAALPLIGPDADEAEILAAMQSAVLAGGGDYSANPFVIGSAADALLCRYKSGRRRLSQTDQLTIEWAGVSAHYHAPMLRTVLVGNPTARHRELHTAALDGMRAIEHVLRPGHTFGEVFDAHAKIMDDRGLTRHRFNACGYSVGARFAPSWMEHQMFHAGNPEVIAADMTLFVHMIIMDSDRETAMTVGHTYLTTETAPRALSRHPLDLINL
ncbi:MAG: Xaa-Pro peptidase family protein [Alphaproteobacteria bacterium]|jgi:Xaa-Pro dipeptidase|uniref:M24 family metallopeptidase n=1 Tax=Rhizobium sp. 'Codium 1' TaxID=2940484 RepID=UPI001E381650|nr:Xaa-Pro peptidase family protein [Rhizobium sp. 'Codium 1']MBU2329616.1 Xaa-Pro peptidase family protein [Alphaproteobacteria bacterium]MCC8932094.1 Xaa-Pro peptidase family protein [Rhizobium sp. 'Codium 1']